MSVLKLFNKETGEWEAIPAIKGDPGDPGAPGEPGKSAYVTTVEATLRADSWESGVNFGFDYGRGQEVPVDGLTADDEGDIGLAPYTTPAQFTAAGAAMLLVGGQRDGFVFVRSLGERPTIDIPIIVRVVRAG